MRFYLLLACCFCLSCSFNERNAEKIETNDYYLFFNPGYFSKQDGIQNAIFLFIKEPPDEFSDHIKIAEEDVSRYEKMDLEYYADLREYVLRDRYTVLERKKNENSIVFVYEKQADQEFKFKTYEQIYFHEGKVFRLSFHSIDTGFDKHFEKAREVLESFRLK